MKFIRFLLIAISLLSISARPAPDSVFPEITTGPTVAVVGLNPQTGTPSGWYTSDVTLQILAPADVLANGKPVLDGQLTVSDEGQHEIELMPGPFGQANTVTLIVNIDKTPPLVRWITEPNSAISGYAALSAEITDATSGIYSLEWSLDHGRSWETQFISSPTPSTMPVVYETTWSLHRNFADFEKGSQVILLRAWDCAGNVSPGEILVFRVE